MPLHPFVAKIKRNLPRAAVAEGFRARVTSGYRSYAKQKWLYDRYLRGLQPYPVAPPGTSDHEKGIALDVVSTDTAKLARLLTSVGFRWGGPADPVHFVLVGPQIASQSEKIEFQVPKTLKQAAQVFFEPPPVKIVRWLQDPVQAVKDNVALAFDVVTWMI